MKQLGQIIAFIGGITIAVGGFALMVSSNLDHRLILAAIVQAGAAVFLGGLALGIWETERKKTETAYSAVAKLRFQKRHSHF